MATGEEIALMARLNERAYARRRPPINVPTSEDLRPTPSMSLMRGGPDTGTRYGGFSDILDSLVTNALRVPSFIGDPSGSGRNVAAQYQPGGQFSSQRSLGDLRTVIPSSLTSLTGMWSRVQPLRAATTPTPAATRFNFSARAPTTQPSFRFGGRGVDYGPSDRNLYGPYHSVLAIQPRQ
jgi:hypothetical protein